MSNKEKIIEQWTKHYINVLNRSSAINKGAITRFPQTPVNDLLEKSPTEEGVANAIKR